MEFASGLIALGIFCAILRQHIFVYGQSSVFTMLAGLLVH